MTPQDNEVLTRVGPGTPMGELMREYWIPACLPHELKPDAPPIRLKLLGEKLIAFRDSQGRVGIMDHRCPHRNASLFFGRNGQGGLQCAYHGWKFDVQGHCLDMPNLPPDQQFRARVRAAAYKTAEFGGLVWVYMGRREDPPPFPALEVLGLPDDQRQVSCHQRDCNWLQSMEGDLDTSHFGFLHVGAVQPDDIEPDNLYRWGLIDRAPRYHVKETDWGAMYAAYRPADSGRTFYRFAHFVFPCFALIPDGAMRSMIQATLSVPLDDHHTMTYHLSWVGRESPLRRLKDGGFIPGAGPSGPYLPATSDWLGRWRLAANRDNDYLIDRDAQYGGQSFSGITGIGPQDQAMVESMSGDDEGIVDRSREHLASSDRMVMLTRRRLLAAARAHQADGAVPLNVDAPEVLRGARGGSFVADDGIDWLQAYQAQLDEAASPTGFLQRQE
ncbi:MAG TPA: Rieske 2Fe-2S domain-containing protein [Burkholderiaceae bacterium]|nr:Rieske 2Fe-2S domain-containing protein [Burkholderiaceae bacterium]